jgi:hypothetical protein
MEYRIIESRPVTQYWEYIVTADSETEALNKVLDGEVEADETWVEDDNDESDYEIYSNNN